MKRPWRSVVVALAVLALSGCSIAPQPAPSPTSRPLSGIPANAHLYVIGDSWSAGFGATPSKTLTIVAGLALGWTVQMDAVSGTGYAKAFVAGTSTFEQRVQALPEAQRADVVLIQGSTNDETIPAGTLRPAVERTVGLVRDRFPGAKVVMLGPGIYATDDAARIGEVDRTLAAAARTAAVPYISMIRERWISKSNIDTVIGLDSQHPTEEGDAYLGGRLAADLRALGG